MKPRVSRLSNLPVMQAGDPSTSGTKESGAVLGSPDTGGDGGWRVPDDKDHSGTIKVPAGDDNAHTVTFKRPLLEQTGMLIQFALERQGTKATDTRAGVTVVGMELRY